MRRSLGESGFRNGEQTTWNTRDVAADAELDLAHVGVVDVAAEHDDRGRRGASSAPALTLRSQSQSRSNDGLNAAQCSRSTARRSFSLSRADGRPQRPSHSASFHASR